MRKTADGFMKNRENSLSSLREGAFGAAGRFLIALDTLATGLTACALSVFATQIHLSRRERQEHCRKLSHCT